METRLIRNLYIALLILTLASCARTDNVREPQRQVGLEMMLPKSAEQIRLKDKEAFLLPSPIEADLPTYPKTIAGVPAVSICVEIVVDTDGAVASVRQIDDGDACEPTGSDLSGKFMPSVADALRRWSFAAAAICRYETAEADCDAFPTKGAQLMPIAVKLAYKIEFLQRDGVTSVRKHELAEN
ncbi:hypothetical protein [Lysobacter enzymogenes]|uniref:Lipoprotein n=1 Tax=Lysobacter enzymogenes TaxID=69 RepID=A0AAU9AGW0_LYSEN|nr:hypothetical protein [Lysobacter enzymogenes]BAV96610.1 hypothetical protein LEN_1123 [Lysobacter enzymogenes]